MLVVYPQRIEYSMTFNIEESVLVGFLWNVSNALEGNTFLLPRLRTNLGGMSHRTQNLDHSNPDDEVSSDAHRKQHLIYRHMMIS